VEGFYFNYVMFSRVYDNLGSNYYTLACLISNF